MVLKANLSTTRVFSSEENQMIKRKDLSLFFRFRTFARSQHSGIVTWNLTMKYIMHFLFLNKQVL